MAETLPSYDQLPVDPSLPAGSSWGVWGERDVFGCLNLLTPERVAAAAGLARRGAVFALNADMTIPDPPLFNRSRMRHTVTGEEGGSSHDDVLSDWNTQASSQWDGFRHVGHPVHGRYGGVPDAEHGIHHWARRGLAGRAVLVDVGRHREADGRPLRMDEPDPITPDDLDAALRAQGTRIETGDVLLVRTGWLSWYRSLDEAGRRHTAENLACPGLAPGRPTAAALWDLHVAAVASDTPALELWPPGSTLSPEELEAVRADPERRPELFVHTSLLPLLGLPIGELFELDALADDSAADGRYESFFTSAPLNLPAGAASPPNALCIK
jgi:kynurenine formamidase